MVWAWVGQGQECLAPLWPGTNVCSLGSLSLQKVFCGHEHTLSNLEFAQKVEPCNEHVQAKLSWAQVHPSIASWVGEGEGGGTEVAFLKFGVS